ncbi:MAG: hypothetical protein ACFFFT_11205 [Candidatus Thorarchaeota archaeon]
MVLPNNQNTGPSQVVRDQVASEITGPVGHSGNQRFYLCITSGRVVESSIKARINLDGVEYLMIGSGDGLWTYDASNLCVPEHNYSFRVTYKNTSGQSKEKRLDNNGQNFVSTVPGYDNLVWYPKTMDRLAAWGSPGSEQPISPHKLGFWVDVGGRGVLTRHVILLNLSNTQANVQNISLTPGLGGEDNAEFSLQLPTLPVSLACGETLEFSVSWDRPEGRSGLTSSGMMGISWNNNQGQMTIYMSGFYNAG